MKLYISDFKYIYIYIYIYICIILERVNSKTVLISPHFIFSKLHTSKIKNHEQEKIRQISIAHVYVIYIKSDAKNENNCLTKYNYIQTKHFFTYRKTF